MTTKRSNLTLSAIHPFPARMASSVAFRHLRELQPGAVVLDPMSGSGTTLAVAKSLGLTAYGTDLDPLAVLLAKTWCAELNADRVRRMAGRVLADAASTEWSTGSRHPAHANDETCAFIDYWFDTICSQQLVALSERIGRVREASLRDALWAAFSRMIVAKQASVSLAMDLPHSRPHRVRERAIVTPFERFLPCMELVLKALPFAPSADRFRPVSVSVGDARDIRLPDDSVDAVLTSPPYVNAIDYLRTSKFSLVWMGYQIAELRSVRAKSIGSEVSRGLSFDVFIEEDCKASVDGPALPGRQWGMLLRYASDLDLVIQNAARVLRPNGIAVFVVANSNLRGASINTAQLVKACAGRASLKMVSEATRAIPDRLRYLPPPKTGDAQLRSRMRREVVLRFTKNSAAADTR